ncbi:MAG TPA: low temperature requirement protein A [Candidatus Dormibacteraeota bacterium]
MQSRALHLFKAWFWSPPRPHGESIVDRRVSPLELLYDLVYAAVIAQAGLRLAEEVSARAVLDFALVFSLTWIAWTNGSLYLELHGRSNGRTRAYVFLQIGILAILAIYAADAGTTGGPGFAIAYAAFLAVMTWLWYDVRRQDVIARRPEFVLDAGRYVVAMAVSVALVLVSALLPEAARLVAWAVYVLGWAVLLSVLAGVGVGISRALVPTDSLVDRFGTFTLIVLGEVVFGVVDGLSRSRHDLETIATGMVALVVGFGFWWIYFDVVGGRFPKHEGRALANWILSHHPVTLSIAAAGAGMVSLLEHAHDAATPASTAWLLSGAVAVGLCFLVPNSRALADAAARPAAFRPLGFALAAGAALSLVIGWARPAPWLLALLLVAVLGLVWAVAVRAFVTAGLWSAEA